MGIDYRFRLDHLETLFASIVQGWIQARVPYRDFALPELDRNLWRMRVGPIGGIYGLIQPANSKIASISIVDVRILPGDPHLIQHPEGGAVSRA